MRPYFLTAALLAFSFAAVAQTPSQAAFEQPVPASALTFLTPLAGQPSGTVIGDKRLRKLLKDFVPDCQFHYGVDMPLTQALEKMLDRSPEPARLEEGRYLMLSGAGGQHAFLWLDLQAGIGVGGIFFRPSNGEPTPTLTIFARQLRTKAIGMTDLPAAFADGLNAWQRRSAVPRLETRYFIGGNNYKVILQHRVDYCAATAGGAPAPAACARMNAAAADMDLNGAYYTEQTHHAPNATARMIFDPEQVAWFGLRERTCHGAPDIVGCRAHLTQERIRVILHGHARG